MGSGVGMVGYFLTQWCNEHVRKRKNIFNKPFLQYPCRFEPAGHSHFWCGPVSEKLCPGPPSATCNHLPSSKNKWSKFLLCVLCQVWRARILQGWSSCQVMILCHFAEEAELSTPRWEDVTSRWICLKITHWHKLPSVTFQAKQAAWHANGEKQCPVIFQTNGHQSQLVVSPRPHATTAENDSYESGLSARDLQLCASTKSWCLNQNSNLPHPPLSWNKPHPEHPSLPPHPQKETIDSLSTKR